MLTSGRTGSAGEEYAYDFQTRKRGNLVGETALGAARATAAHAFDGGKGETEKPAFMVTKSGC